MTNYHIVEGEHRPCVAKSPETCDYAGRDDVVHFSAGTAAEARLKVQEIEGSRNQVVPNGSTVNRGKRISDKELRSNPNRRKKTRDESIGGVPIYKFHKDVGFPSDLKLERYTKARARLNWSHHARQSAETEELGEIPQLREMDARMFELIEVKADRETLTPKRLLFRAENPQTNIAYCFVVDVSRRDWFVVTCWSNYADDRHSNLNTSEYSSPDQKPDGVKAPAASGNSGGSGRVTPSASPGVRTPQRVPQGGAAAMPPKPGPRPTPSSIPKPGPRPGNTANTVVSASNKPKPAPPKPGPRGLPRNVVPRTPLVTQVHS